MNDQLSLFEPETTPARPGLFLAILPPPEICRWIAALRAGLMRKYQLAGYVVPESQLHITLCHFNANREPLKRLIQISKEVGELTAASTAPFEVRLNRIEGFGGGSMVLTDRAGNTELRRFRETLMTEFKNQRFSPKKNSGFTPHLTLLREQWKIHEESVDPIVWMAEEVVLVRHVPKQEYEIIGPWKFGG